MLINTLWVIFSNKIPVLLKAFDLFYPKKMRFDFFTNVIMWLILCGIIVNIGPGFMTARPPLMWLVRFCLSQNVSSQIVHSCPSPWCTVQKSWLPRTLRLLFGKWFIGVWKVCGWVYPQVLCFMGVFSIKLRTSSEVEKKLAM